MRRATVSNTKWHPKASDRVCSDHFVDNEPTELHQSILILHLILVITYLVQNSSRRELFRQPLAKKKKHINISNEPIPLLVDESVQCCSSSTLTSPPPPLYAKFNITSAMSPSTFVSPMSSEHSYSLLIGLNSFHILLGEELKPTRK